jgi:hypothetical protein
MCGCLCSFIGVHRSVCFIEWHFYFISQERERGRRGEAQGAIKLAEPGKVVPAAAAALVMI